MLVDLVLYMESVDNGILARSHFLLPDLKNFVSDEQIDGEGFIRLRRLGFLGCNFFISRHHIRRTRPTPDQHGG